MTIPRKILEEASFWDRLVCLDCEATFDAPRGDLGGEVIECPACESDATFSAALVLRCADFVEPSDDDA